MAWLRNRKRLRCRLLRQRRQRKQRRSRTIFRSRTMRSAADTAQVFLGTAIKCASCHSHFLNDEWPQARAVAFSGYFSDKDMELVRCERSSGQFVKTHFMFDLPAAPTSAPSDSNAR